MPSINLGRVRGDKGTSMRNRGVWNSALKYVNDKDYIDLVSHNGSLWTCMTTNTNVEPSDTAVEWNLTAKSIDTVYFEPAQSRENIVSGESANTVFGKIAKWLADFKDAAFYNVVNGVTQTKAGEAVLDAAVGKYLDEKKFDVSKIIASRTITEYGFAMDGKTVADWLSELNSKLENCIFEEGSNNNGHFRKYANGTLEMWGNVSISSIPVTTASGTLYNSTNRNLTLPHTSLTGVQGVSLELRSNTGIWPVYTTGGDNKSTLGYLLKSGASTTMASGVISFRCTGTWK